MRWLFPITVSAVGLLAACSDDGTGSTGSDGTSTASETTASSGDGDGDTQPMLVGEPMIIHHPNQPMIIDVIVELDAPGTGELVHTTDNDVRVALLEPADGAPATTLHFRVRGLLPDTAHPLALSIDGVDTWQGEVTTDPPLPGFIAKFEIDSLGETAVEPIWRLFDMTELFTTQPSGLFMVDYEGTTRWYIGDADDYTDLDDVFQGVHLRPDGTVSFTRRDAGVIVDELGNTIMQVEADAIGANAGFHHDMIELPTGNFLVLSYAFQDVFYQGEGMLHVAGDKIFEFTPDGQQVWTWDAFDHLDPQRRRDGFYIPQKVPDPDTGTNAYDWTHGNALAYTQADDTVYISMRHQDWFVAIDHQTGDVRWRLGDEGDFALVGTDQWFFHQHAPQWQADGSLMLYDNAVGNPAQPDTDAHSRAVRYALDQDAMTVSELWVDDDPLFRSVLAGDAYMTPAGHVLRLDAMWIDADHPIPSSRLRELDPMVTPNAVWTLYMPQAKFSYRGVPLDRFVGVPE